MDMTLAQEDGLDNDLEDDPAASAATSGNATGITKTTSKARMWLARWELSRNNLKRANQLANELCEDGIEVEEAKALIRDIRARMNSDV